MSEILFPSRIHIEPSNFCNQKCHLCPRNEMERAEGNMSLEVFQKIADDCQGHDPKLWLHFMGEPLLNKSLFDMVRYAKGLGMSEVGFSTNASFLDDRLAQEILDSPLDRLEFSIDALDAEYFHHMRGIDEYHHVKANVEKFLQLKYEQKRSIPRTSIQFMSTPENQARRGEISAAWEPRLQGDDFIMFINEMDFVDFDRRLPTQTIYERTPCNWLWKYCVVLWNGDVALCASDYDGTDIMGNVMEQSLEEIFNGEKYRAYRELHVAGDYAKIANCAKCEVWRTMEFQGHETPGYTNILAK